MPASSPDGGLAALGTLGATLDDADWIMPCEEGSPEHDAARSALDDLDRAIADLALDADPKPLAQRMEALDGERCFAIERAQNHFEARDFGSALSLKTFWVGAGPSLRARLAWSRDTDREIVLAPTPRSVLTLESAPSHPLRALLCPAAAVAPGVAPLPSTCASETAGWTRRLERTLDLRARAGRAARATRPPALLGDCVAEADAAPKSRAFFVFSQCISRLDASRDALPLGVFKAPSDGWFLVRGRREGCFDLRAYDLASGAAFIGKRCRSAAPRIDVGRLPLDPLREAAWAIFLAKTAEQGVVPAARGYAIPDGMTVRVPPSRGGRLFGGSYGTSSGRTTLVFQWVRGGKSVATGTFQWPDAHRAIDDYATDLLAIAEAGFVAGTPPAKLVPLPWSARGDDKTRIGPAGMSFPVLDEVDLEQLEHDLANGASRVRAKP